VHERVINICAFHDPSTTTESYCALCVFDEPNTSEDCVAPSDGEILLKEQTFRDVSVDCITFSPNFC